MFLAHLRSVAFIDAADRQYDLRSEVKRRAGPGMRLLPGGLREGESGSVAVDLLGMPLDAAFKGLGYLADNPITRVFSEDWIGRARRQLGPEVAGRARNVVANQHRISNDLQPDALTVEKEAAGSTAASMRQIEQVEQPIPDVQFGYDRMQVYSETKLMDRFSKNRSGLSSEETRLVNATDKVNADTREIANGLGMEMKNVFDAAGHRVKIAQTTDQKVLTRQLTADGRDAVENPQFIEALAEENQTTPELMADMLERSGFTGNRSLHRLDAIEGRRGIEFFPSHWRVGNGRFVRLLETDPVHHTERLIRSFSIRAGMHEEFGSDMPPTGKDASQVPFEPYIDVVGKFIGARREFAVKLMQTLAGQHDSPMGRAEERFHRFMQPLMTGYVGGALTSLRSTAQNIVEPLGQGAGMMGFGRVLSAYKDVVGAAVSGDLPKLLDKVIAEGGWKPNIASERTEGVKEKADKAYRITTTAFRFTQNFADMVNRVAAGKLIEDMQSGNSGMTGVSFAQAMDFSPADSRRIASGGGTPEEYSSLLERALPRISGRSLMPGDQPISHAIAQRGFVKFLGYASRFAQNAQRLGEAVKGAKTFDDKVQAYTAFSKFFLGATASGALAKLLYNAVTKGGNEAIDQLTEDFTEHKGESVALGLLGQMFGGVGTTFADGVQALLDNSKDAKLDFVQRAISASAPIRGLIEMYNMATSSGPYSGLGPAGAMWKFGQRMAPVLRDVDRGLLGMPAIAVTTDPLVADSRSKLMRWRDLRGKDIADYGEPTWFTETMRSFELEMRQPDALDQASLPDLAQRIMEARPTDPSDSNYKDEEQWRQSAKQSLLNRRNLNPVWYDKLTPDEKAEMEQFMGEEKMATLRGYDKALEMLAEDVDPIELKNRDAQRRARRRRR